MGSASAELSFQCGFLGTQETIHQFCTTLEHFLGGCQAFKMCPQLNKKTAAPGTPFWSVLQTSYSSKLGSSIQPLTSPSLCGSVCLPTKIHRVLCPNCHCSSRPLLSWLVPGDIPNKTLACLAGKEATELCIASVGFSLLFMGYVVWDKPSAGSSRASRRKDPHTFKIPYMCLNKRVPQGNLPNQLLFYDDDRESAWAESLIRTLSRGHKTVSKEDPPCWPHRLR